jgi:hypothetical protein
MANLGNTTRPAYVYDAETDTWLPIGVGAHTHDQIPASIVDAKGDLIVGTAADTVQKRTVGADGSYLVADSTQTTGLNWAGPSTIAGKNKVMNGDFSIWQRGSTFTSLPSDTKNFFADRWYAIWNGSGSTRTLSRQTFSPGETLGSYNPEYYMRYAISVIGTGNTYTNFSHKIEDVRTLAGQVVTLSAWMKADTNRSITPYFNQDHNTGVASTNIPGAAWNLTTSWQRFTFTTTLQSLAGKTINPNHSLQIYFDCPASTAFSIDVWGVQVEAGSIATNFTTATGTTQGELAACQRYYYRATGSAVNALFSDCGISYSSTKSNIIVKFPVQMRTTPSAVDYTALIVTDLVNYNFNVSSITIEPNNSNQNIVLLDTTSATGTIANRSAWVRAAGAGGYLGLSAEL